MTGAQKTYQAALSATRVLAFIIGAAVTIGITAWLIISVLSSQEAFMLAISRLAIITIAVVLTMVAFNVGQKVLDDRRAVAREAYMSALNETLERFIQNPRAEDWAGNVGWSPVRKTIVPYDQSQLIYKQAGFGHKFFTRGSGYFLGTIWYSRWRGNRIAYKFNGQSVSLIAARGPNRSKAKIYIDGRYVKTIDNYAARTQARQVVFHRCWRRRGTHYLKIVNLATPGRRSFDVDALAVER